MAKIAYIAQHRRGLPELLKQLSETGYIVYRLDPNQMAYRVLRDEPPDLILADMTLRPTHIHEVLDAVSASAMTREIPLAVVGLDANDLEETRTRAPQARELHCGGVTRKLLLDIVKKILVEER